MAIQEHTEEINNITLTATNCALVLTGDNKIIEKIVGGSVNIMTKDKVITGTLLQINAYIKTNSLEDYVQPLPSVE
jgi:hypothetical protein